MPLETMPKHRIPLVPALQLTAFCPKLTKIFPPWTDRQRVMQQWFIFFLRPRSMDAASFEKIFMGFGW
jgi:hypothetical protein